MAAYFALPEKDFNALSNPGQVLTLVSDPYQEGTISNLPFTAITNVNMLKS